MLKCTTLHYSLCPLSFCLAHRHPFSLAETFDIQIASFEILLKSRKLNWKTTGGGHKKGYTSNVKIYYQAGGMAVRLTGPSEMHMHTVSVTITSNKLQSFSFIWKAFNTGEDSALELSLRDRDTWQKIKYLATVSVGDVGNLAVVLCLCNSHHLDGLQSSSFFS